jgi:TorA maturation chaperone TorD
MQTNASPVEETINAEARARADWYAFLGRIWYAGPDESLLRAIAGAGEVVSEGNVTQLDDTWRQLVTVAKTATPQSLKPEYDSVFVGTGRAEITPYMSHYLLGSTGKEKYLLHIRQLLDELGLARAEAAHEPEDHVAALCEIMRHLIVSGGEDEHTLDQQAQFFNRYIAPGYADFVAAVLASPNTDFYKSVACFTEAFFDIEVTSFQML